MEDKYGRMDDSRYYKKRWLKIVIENDTRTFAGEIVKLVKDRIKLGCLITRV